MPNYGAAGPCWQGLQASPCSSSRCRQPQAALGPRLRNCALLPPLLGRLSSVAVFSSSRGFPSLCLFPLLVRTPAMLD